MQVSSIGTFNQKELRNREDYRAHTRYYEGALFGQIESEKTNRCESGVSSGSFMNFIKGLVSSSQNEMMGKKALNLIG